MNDILFKVRLSLLLINVKAKTIIFKGLDCANDKNEMKTPRQKQFMITNIPMNFNTIGEIVLDLCSTQVKIVFFIFKGNNWSVLTSFYITDCL